MHQNFAILMRVFRVLKQALTLLTMSPSTITFPPKEKPQKSWVPVRSTSKMATENLIARELMSTISEYPYRRYVQVMSAPLCSI